MRVRFCGVRGSVPWVVPDATAHGCNTPCVEITDDRGDAMLVLDAGTGIFGVRPRPGTRVSILFTHYHWDHVIGLPSFAPFYDATSRFSVHAPALPSHDPSWLRTIFGAPFYPMSYDGLPNHPAPRLVEPGPVGIDGFEVTAAALNHPGGAFAYRIRGRDGDLVFATDHEFGDSACDALLGEFLRGAAVAILDAHFTPDELPSHRGWGHSDWRQCAEFAAAHDVGALYLYHHKPGRSDADLDGIQAAARAIFAGTHTAREGHSIAL
jgi:phosphoribosyl 1,2-cyclic phosphodiesterase